MIQVKTFRGGNVSLDYKASCPSTIAPAIKKQYYQGKGKDRTRMYETVDGRNFLADVYDRNFNQGVKLKMKPKNFRAKSLDPRIIY